MDMFIYIRFQYLNNMLNILFQGSLVFVDPC